jgi:CheY-like chemotaxis protein
MGNKILLVDDEETIRGLFKEYLSEEGFSVKAASSGKEAIEITREEKFDIFLIDLVMPEMDGLELLQQLRTLKIDTPAILLTGYEIELDESRKEGLNVVGVISKGIPMAEASKKVRNQISKSKSGIT